MKLEVTREELRDLTAPPQPEVTALVAMEMLAAWIKKEGLVQVYLSLNAYVTALRKALPAEVLKVLEPAKTPEPALEVGAISPPGANDDEPAQPVS